MLNSIFLHEFGCFHNRSIIINGDNLAAHPMLHQHDKPPFLAAVTLGSRIEPYLTLLFKQPENTLAL
jgi:hypothetical protein